MQNALGSIHGADLPGKIKKAAKDILMDLMEPSYGVHLDLPDESAVKQLIHFLIALLIQ